MTTCFPPMIHLFSPLPLVYILTFLPYSSIAVPPPIKTPPYLQVYPLRFSWDYADFWLFPVQHVPELCKLITFPPTDTTFDPILYRRTSVSTGQKDTLSFNSKCGSVGYELDKKGNVFKFRPETIIVRHEFPGYKRTLLSVNFFSLLFFTSSSLLFFHQH